MEEVNKEIGNQKELKVTFNTNYRKFFRQYTAILSPILKIKDKEQEVLAELLYQNYKRAYIKDDKERFKLVFDYDTKMEMATHLGMDAQQLRTYFCNLRKKGYIKGYAELSKNLLVYPDSNFSFIYEFKIEDNGSNG